MNICVNIFTEQMTERFTFHKMNIVMPEEELPQTKEVISFLIEIPRFAFGKLTAGCV